MRHESSITSLYWMPSEAIEGSTGSTTVKVGPVSRTCEAFSSGHRRDQRKSPSRS